MASETIVQSQGGGGLIANLAELSGAPEPALRLLLSILFGYPIAALHQLCVRKLEPLLQHIFFATCGFALCYFNYGTDSYHSVIAIWVTYLLVRLLHHAPQQLLIINFLFHMSYLIIGYIFTESNDYDIIWTMPHCVLVLRLIGFGFDISDGQKPREQLSNDQKETALSYIPSLIELTAYTFFPAAFLVGPQFPFRRYQRFIGGEFHEHDGAVNAGLKRGGVGLLYLIVRQLGATLLPDSYLMTEAFRNQSMLTKLFQVGIWGKIALYKFISCWLLVEGALMCTGFTYAGKTSDGKSDWSGCSNIKLILLETGSKMAHYVQSFNVNTNSWVAQYIYKRLKFLNNRMISYVAALAFLAVWHGFHSGYYIAFAMEYAIITFEKQCETIYAKDVIPKYGDILNNSKACKVISFVLLKIYNIMFMGWCLIPFILLSYDRYMYVYSTLGYYGFVMLASWLIVYNGYKFSRKSNKTDKTSSNEPEKKQN
ncbi:lysophospholipid acyltransferase 5 [Episyrphus balteatus]|uniref:lysophospholipid acyltransferase 5 n=1 Tax=Episyrphus balteatus TaxID=286459 RepID=UPI002485E322|nr:lysophospholipid acyltransferase 5 [Episyrphus balteatus]